MPSATPAIKPHPGPAFLRALDHVLATDTGWVSQCPVFECIELLDITPGPDGHWHFACDGQHTHQDVVDYLQCDTRLGAEDTRRIWRAMVLSAALEVCEALLKGQDVPRSALDPLWLKRLGL